MEAVRKYIIAVHFTVEGETVDDAKNNLRDCISAALTGESGPIEDFSVEDVLEYWDADGSVNLMGD